LLTEDLHGLSVDATRQQLIQLVLSEDDKAITTEVEALNQQSDKLHREIAELA